MMCERPPRSLRSRLPLTRGRVRYSPPPWRPSKSCKTDRCWARTELKPGHVETISRLDTGTDLNAAAVGAGLGAGRTFGALCSAYSPRRTGPETDPEEV